MKKILVMVLIMGVLLVGCATEATNKETISNGNEGENTTVDDRGEEGLPGTVEEESLPVDPNVKECTIAFDVVGEIIQMDGDMFHIISGDIVEIFKVSTEVINDFYIGDTVGLVKNGEHYEVYQYEISDFSRRYTTMGEYITEITGEVIRVTDTELVISVEGDEKIFEIYGPVFADPSQIITVDYIDTLEGTIFLEVYNETNKLTTQVIKTEKSEDGSMIVYLGLDGEVEYVANLTNTVVNFQLADLVTGDMVDVYFETADLSYPAQIGPKKMLKTN